MSPKEFYRVYRADPTISPIAEEMMTLMNYDRCVHAFEYGMGEGKHLRRLREKGLSTFGIDISILNVFKAQAQLDGTMLGDENYLRHFCNADCVFTVSVLDHIEDIDAIIGEFKRIANKVVYLLETNDQPGEYYYPHEYESYGFKKLPLIEWVSDGDGATYYLWRWYKNQPNDDLCAG